MSWTQFIDDRQQRWMVNQMGLYMLIREYLHESLIHQRARVVRETRWFGPDLVTVDINFNGLRAQKDAEAPRLYEEFARRMLHDGGECFARLAELRRITKDHADAVTRMQREASRETMSNIERSVSIGEAGLQAATVVRDLSATTLVVGATFLSGGAALAVLGGGSALKGTGTYQDTGNVGAAILDGSMTFVVGAIGVSAAANPATANAASMTTRLGQAASGGIRQAVAQNVSQRGAVILVGASLNAVGEGLKGHMTGKSAESSLRMAAARFGTDLASNLLAGPILEHMCLPVLVRAVTDTTMNAAADRAVGAAAVPQAVAAAPPNVQALFDAATSGSDGADYIERNILRRA